MTTVVRPPGPKTILWGIANIASMTRKPLDFLTESAREHGGFVYHRFGPFHAYMISQPRLIHDVLVKQAGKLKKWDRMKETMGKVTGDGLLTSDGTVWREHRKLVQPALHTNKIRHYAGIMTDYTTRMIDGWKDGETIDLHDHLMKLTMDIITRALFGVDITAEAPQISQAIRVAQAMVVREVASIIILPGWLPTPRNQRERQAMKALKTYIRDAIEKRRAEAENHNDLLSTLLAVRDEEGRRMTDEQVYDEAMTLFMAGHDSTSNALSWLWYLMTQHPTIEQKMNDQVTEALEGRKPELEDLEKLAYIEMIFKETLRLYPPVWAFMRQTTEDIEVGGYTIGKDSMIYVSPWVVHRDAQNFEAPDTFNPERFSPENEKNIEPYAYFPFGGGPRVCIGNHFAMMEAKITTALITQRVHFELAPGQDIQPESSLTLRPKGGLRVIIHKR